MNNKKSDTLQKLTTALLREGQGELASIWGVDQTTVGRKTNNQLGIKLSEFAEAMDFLLIQVITPDENVELIDRDELQALRTLAKKGLTD